jgi:hypothetical protein
MTAITAFFFLTLPWLNPFSPGPTAAVVPLLFSWVCAALAVLVVVATRTPTTSQSLVRILVLAWLAGASVSALIGLLQYFGSTAWAGPWLNHTSIGEAYGNLRQRNQFATLMNIGLVALLWWTASPPEAWINKNWPSLPPRMRFFVCVMLAMLISAGNAASSSRTGLVQLGLLSVLTWIWLRPSASSRGQVWHLRNVAPILLIALLAYAVATVALPLLAGLDPAASGAWARLKSGDTVCSSRITLWGNVLHLIGQKPWLGWGWGELDYAHFVTLYSGERFCDILDNAHNLPLHLAVEFGLPVATLACGTGTWLLWRARPWREPDTTRQMAWGILAMVGLHSLLEYPLWYGPFQIAALAAIWLLQAKSSEKVQPFNTVVLYSKGLIATFIIAFSLVLAWHYHLASQIYLSPENRMAAYQADTQKKIQGILFFQDQVRFAELTTADLTIENAKAIHALALDMLHFSPEPRVIELILDSARLLGKIDEADFYARRYQAAFPEAYARWLATKSGLVNPTSQAGGSISNH